MTSLAREKNGLVIGAAIPAMRLGATHALLSDGTNTSGTGPLGADTSVVRVYAAAALRVAIGEVATATSTPMPAGSVEYFAIRAGEAVSVLGDGAAASATVTECE